MAAPPDALDRYREYLQAEIDSAFLYLTLAELADSEQLAEVYRRLAATEERHAKVWRERVRSAGAELPPERPTRRARALAWLARRLGPDFVLPTLVEQEALDSHTYDEYERLGEPGMSADERSHARILRTIRGGLPGSELARFEGRHRAIGGNALRAAVLGANDGLLSNFSLIMGVAGAELSNESILITGIAGLLAGAGSMALGEWISVQSSRELQEHQIEVERAELAEMPDEEREELVLIYEAKGVERANAERLADRLLADREQALDTLVREELGIDPGELGGSAWTAAGASFALFAIGAVIPLVSFIFLSGTAAVALSVALSAAGLFGLGAATALITGRGVAYSGMRQLLIGVAAAAITYGVGSLIGGVVA
ncbi:MAG TPA: VIT1/CCC1 transporter family protein [Solirubrobacterales bacterium]